MTMADKKLQNLISPIFLQILMGNDRKVPEGDVERILNESESGDKESESGDEEQMSVQEKLEMAKFQKWLRGSIEKKLREIVEEVVRMGIVEEVVRTEMKRILGKEIPQKVFGSEAERLLAETKPEGLDPTQIWSIEMEKWISNFLRGIGIPYKIKGFAYLVDAIRLCSEDPRRLQYVTKFIYPEVAKRIGVSAPSVERCMRHALEMVYRNGNKDILKNLFPSCPARRPTNTEAIKVLVSCFRLN